MKTLILLLSFVTMSLFTVGAANADLAISQTSSTPFLFGNDIDTHSQFQIKNDGSLTGYLFIWFTGDTTSDGYKVATHVNCSTTPGCTVGWAVNGLAGTGTFLYMANDATGMMDHPVFLVDRRDIPQPGAYAHFHWLGAMPSTGQRVNGYFLQLTAKNTFCFFHMMMPGMTINPGATCKANGGIPVTNSGSGVGSSGLDIATHVNIVTSYPGY